MLDSINSGDTAWILLCTALAFLALPGLAFFYSRLIRKPQFLNAITVWMTIACLVLLQWVFFGYSLSFGPDHGGWTGTLAWAALRSVGAEPNLEYAGTIPHIALMMYRGMSAALAPIIFLTPFADRLRIRSVVCITILWTTLVYDPVAHWVWGVGGFLRISGVLDFAGGTALYLNAGMAALALALILRKSDEPSPAETSAPSNNLGLSLLWLGWLGLNVGNAFGANEIAANAFVMTQLAAASGALVWLMLDKLLQQELSPLGMITGAVAGWVAVSSSAGSANIGVALSDGIGAAILCYMSIVLLQKKWGWDAAIYPIGIFAVGSLWGLIITGLVGGQLLIQLRAAFAISLYSFGMSYLILKTTSFVIGLRPSET